MPGCSVRRRFRWHIANGQSPTFRSSTAAIAYVRILNASRVPDFAVKGNRSIVRQGVLEPGLVQRALDFKVSVGQRDHGDQSSNADTREPRLETDMSLRIYSNAFARAGSRLQCLGTPHLSTRCRADDSEMVHPWVDSCKDTSFRRFFSVFVGRPRYGTDESDSCCRCTRPYISYPL